METEKTETIESYLLFTEGQMDFLERNGVDVKKETAGMGLSEINSWYRDVMDGIKSALTSGHF